MRAGILLLVLALMGSGASAVHAAETQCRIVHAVDVDMGSDEVGSVMVPMMIAGKTVHLLVDTGGVASMLTKKNVDELKLPNGPMAQGHALVMFGGQRIDRIATARDIDFGGLKAGVMKFVVMPDGFMRPGFDGTLAPDILNSYDAEFDFANNKFYLNSQDHCPGRVVYWTASPYAVIPMWVGSEGHVNIVVDLDSKKINAVIDTGSTRSIMSLDDAENEFGFDEKSTNLKNASDSDKSNAYLYPFKSLSLEGITIKNPDLILVPDARSHAMKAGGPQIILGMGILRQLHLYIAYGEQKIYATGASAH